MLDLLTIALEAHSDERNHHRRYEVSVGRDLLGDWVVTVRYGRVGGPLRELRFVSMDMEEAGEIVQARLRRRKSAPSRIHCSYRLVGIIIAQGFSMASRIDGTRVEDLWEDGAFRRVRSDPDPESAWRVGSRA